MIFTVTMLLTSSALAQEHTAKTLADVDGTDYHGIVIEIPKEGWGCKIRKTCTGIVMKVTPTPCSPRWREMLRMLKDKGAPSEIVSRTVSMTFVADIVDGEISWQELSWIDTNNKAAATLDVLPNRTLQEILTAWFDEIMSLERTVGESQRAQKRLK
jgi:hypothetical protein